MTHLTILHTNDLHGRVPQLLRIATLVRQIRREAEAAGGYCLYVDAGDSEDTTLLECGGTYYQAEGTEYVLVNVE